MKSLFVVIFLSIFFTVHAQQCQARFNRSIIGQYSSIANCQGTILNSNGLGAQSCCINSTAPSTSQTCLKDSDFTPLYNTSRAQFLRIVLNYGLAKAGICEDCQAKAAFLAIAATMTNNFQTDEATGSDAEFIADDQKYGNSQEGDGSRYRQRGFFGLRGRTMYERLQRLMPEYASVGNPESVALTQNAITIAALLWNSPTLQNGYALTNHTDGSFYGFSMLWYKLTGNTKQLSTAAKYYSTFLRQLECGGDLYPGQGPICQYNATHQGACSADCIKGLEDSSTFCGCSGSTGEQCSGSPKHIRCCLGTCSQELKMDLGLVLDASGSIGFDNYRLQLQFTRDLLRQVNVGPNKTHVAIINYSNDVQTLTQLNRDYTLQQKLLSVDRATYYDSGTNTSAGLREANRAFSYSQGRRLSSEGVTPVIFVITDGASNDQKATIQAASVLKGNGITLISVGVGKGPNLTELYAICTPPASENYFAISNYSALERKINQFTSKSCSEPAPVPSNTTVTGEVGKDKYKFLKVKIIIAGNKILITAKFLKGRVKIFFSFNNRNPKDPADFIDYDTEKSDSKSTAWTQVKSYFQQSLSRATTAKDDEAKVEIERPNDEVDFVYVGIKGVDEDNKFEVRFDDCAKVECSKSGASVMKLSLILVFISCLLIF